METANQLQKVSGAELEEEIGGIVDSAGPRPFESWRSS
jgi:hypothetical protein